MTSAAAPGLRHIPPSAVYTSAMNKGKNSRSPAQKTQKKNAGRAQYILCFLILLMTAGTSLGSEVLLGFHISPNTITVTLLAIAISLLMAHRNIMLVVLVVGLSFCVNLPPEVLQGYGIDRTILLGTLLALLLEPVAWRLIFGKKVQA